MPGPGIRANARDVFFYDLRDPSTQLGGLHITQGVTNANFYSMIDIVLIIPRTYFLQNDNDETIPRDLQSLLPGNYFIVTDGTIDVSDEITVTRTRSHSGGTRTEVFTDQVRERDQHCVITKLDNLMARAGLWVGFEAAHIFPLGCERDWNKNNFSRWITISPSRGGAINSVQNGLLLQSTVHQLFDAFIISINPDVSFLLLLFQASFLL